jgi:hypothetical protein
LRQNICLDTDIQKQINSSVYQKLSHSNVRFNFANVQTKLGVIRPSVIYEREADRVAEQVMGRSASNHRSATVSNQVEGIDRKYLSGELKEGKEEKHLNISRKPSSTSTGLYIRNFPISFSTDTENTIPNSV